MAHIETLPRTPADVKRTARLLERYLLTGIVLATSFMTMTAIGSALANRLLNIGGQF